MNREQKNQLTRRRIMDNALAEFSRSGYAGSSVNNVCAAQGISKGIIYHYFETKDALFLACVGECFSLLTEAIEERMQAAQGSVEQQLALYFTARLSFFHAHPVYQRIFCEAVIAPPPALAADIQQQRREFDALNVRILTRLLSSVSLRPGISRDEVVETFRLFQDFVNARFPAKGMDMAEFELREKSCQTALSLLLYGVVERKE